MMSSQESMMRLALEQARLGASKGEVPVGAVIVLKGKLIALAHNCPIAESDSTAHAEVLAIRAACRELHTYRLVGAAMYVTLEPCVMCIGAAINARLDCLIFGAWDDKAGAAGSVYDIGRDGRLNHSIEMRGGVMEADCSGLMRDFFRQRRA
jgi:tRNA(adenine34) deaminase